MTGTEFLDSVYCGRLIKRYRHLFRIVGYDEDDIMQIMRISVWKHNMNYDSPALFIQALRCDIVDEFRTLSHVRSKRNKRIGVVYESASEKISKIYQRGVSNKYVMPDNAFEEMNSFNHLIKRFPAYEREIMRLRYVDDLGYKEIGQRVGRTRSCVRLVVEKVQKELASAIA